MAPDQFILRCPRNPLSKTRQRQRAAGQRSCLPVLPHAFPRPTGLFSQTPSVFPQQLLGVGLKTRFILLVQRHFHRSCAVGTSIICVMGLQNLCAYTHPLYVTSKLPVGEFQSHSPSRGNTNCHSHHYPAKKLRLVKVKSCLVLRHFLVTRELSSRGQQHLNPSHSQDEFTF